MSSSAKLWFFSGLLCSFLTLRFLGTFAVTICHMEPEDIEAYAEELRQRGIDPTRAVIRLTARMNQKKAEQAAREIAELERLYTLVPKR